MERSGIAELSLHGGKDGYPYPVNKEGYEESIEFLKQTISKTKISHFEKRKSIEEGKSF
ncbi:MAG: hypothetical protein KAS39_02250 [Actinomycetia bacterium]|nr:hypothetical protein [Actinomycetes bacterium]